MMECSFVVPGEPVPKARARVFADNRTGKIRSATPQSTVDYEARVRLVAQSKRPSGWPMQCRYAVRVDVYRTRAVGDVDNLLKVVLDALNPRRAKGGKRPRPGVPGVLWRDDALVRHAEIEIRETEHTPCVGVRVVALRVLCDCGALTFFPDDEGRCETCAAKTKRRAS